MSQIYGRQQASKILLVLGSPTHKLVLTGSASGLLEKILSDLKSA